MHTRGVRGMGCGLVTLTEENATGTDFASTKPRRSRTLGHLHELEVDEACGTKTGHTIGCAHAHEDCVHGTRRERSHSLESSSSSSSSSSENHLHDDASYKSDSDLSQSQSISSAIRAIRIDNDNDDEYDIEMDNGECGEGTGHDSSGISFDLHMPTMPKYGSTCARHHRSLSLCGSTSCHSSSLSSSSSSSSSTSELHFESPELDSVFEIEDPPKMSSVPSNDSMIMDGHNDVTTPVNNGGSRKKTLGYDYENDESTDAFMLLSPDPSAFEGSESLQRKAIQPINYNKRCPATPERLRRPNRLIRHSSLFDNKLLISFGDMNFTGTIFERDFTDRQIVGEGAFFECYRVADADTGIVYAVKKSKRSFRGKKDRQNYLKEVKLLHALGGHPNIVRVYRAWQQELHFFVQMEHCDGNLSGFVSRLQGHISDRFLITCCAQICQALAHIHRANLIHLDVKPANVLVVLPKDREGRIKCSPGPDRFFDFTLKLTDFGQAILKKEQKDAVEGDSQYMAPELLAIDYTPTSAADIFSLGLLLLEIATGLELPLTGSKWHDLREGKAGEYLSGSITSPNLQAVIESMLHPDPSQRPTALRIIEQLKYLAPSGSRTMNTPSPFGRRSSSM